LQCLPGVLYRRPSSARWNSPFWTGAGG
jgi:hypothetical protein